MSKALKRIAGGGCTCATCHFYVDDEWLAKLPPPFSIELNILEFAAAEKKANSRLSCQIFVAEDLDGLVVYLPPSQR